MKQFNIFDYLDVVGLARDLDLKQDTFWNLEKIDNSGTFTIEEDVENDDMRFAFITNEKLKEAENQERFRN